MKRFDYNKQQALIKALIKHPDNFERSPHFALGYMVHMMAEMSHGLPKMQKDIFMAKVEDIIDRSRKALEDNVAAG